MRERINFYPEFAPEKVGQIIQEIDH